MILNNEDLILNNEGLILNNEDFVNFNRNSYFGYPDYNNSDKNYCLAVINLCFKKYLWDCKLVNIIPRLEGALNSVTGKIKLWYSLSSKFRACWETADIEISILKL